MEFLLPSLWLGLKVAPQKKASLYVVMYLENIFLMVYKGKMVALKKKQKQNEAQY